MQAISFSSTRTRTLVYALLVAVLYFLVARLALLFLVQPGRIAVLWLPGGVALAVLLLTPRSMWLGMLAAMFLANAAANWTGGETLSASLGMAAVNTFETGILAWLMTWRNKPPVQFTRLADMVRLIAFALGVLAVTAFLAATGVLVGGGVPLFTSWSTWYIGNALSIILVTPFIVIWFTRGELYQPFTPRRLAEGAALILVLLGITYFTFANYDDPQITAILRPTLLLPVLIVFALRFSPRGTSAALILVSLVSLAQTIQGTSIFSAFGMQTGQQILATQFFLLVIDISILILSSTVVERRRAENALALSEARFRSLVENMPGAMYRCSAQPPWQISYMSEAFTQISGYSTQTLTSGTMHYADLIFADDLPMVEQHVADIVAQHQPYEIEYRIRHADGRLCWVYEKGQAQYDSAGQPNYLEGVIFDITARKDTEQALAQSEKLYRSLVNVIPDGVALSDAQGNVQFASPQLLAMHGGAPDEPVIGLNALQWIAPQDHAKARANIQALFTDNTLATDHEYTLVRRDGTHFIGEIDAVVLRDEHGAPLGMVTIHRDITERKRVEEELRASQAQLHSIFQAAPIGVGITKNRVIQQINSTFCHMLHYTPAELVGQDARMIYPTQADYDYVGTEKFRRMNALGIGTVETRWQRKDGVVLDILLSSTPLAPNDLSQGILFTALDISERKRVEEELRVSEEKFRKLFDAGSDPLFLLDSETGEFYAANAAALQQYGYTSEELVGKFSTDLSAEPEKSRASLKHHDTFIPFRWHRRKDGSTFPAEINISYFSWNNQRVRLSSVRDISKRLVAENALRTSEERYRRLFSEMLNGFALHEIITDSEGMPRDYRFLQVNPAFEKMTGLCAADLVGKTVLEVLPMTESHWINIYGRVALTGEPVHFENYSSALGKHLEVTAFSPQSGQFATIFGDVTARHQREQELQAIASVSAALRSVNTRAEMLPLLLDQISRLLNTAGVIIGAYDPHTSEGYVEAGQGVWANTHGRRTPAGQGISGRIYTTGKPYITDNLAQDPLMYHRQESEFVRGAIYMPLVAPNQIIGWLGIGAHHPFTQTDVSILTTIAEIAANALFRASLHDQTIQHIQRLTALNVIERTINASLDLRVTLNILLDQVNAQLGVDASALLLFNRRTQILECRAERGRRDSSHLGTLIRLGNDATSRAIVERRLVSLPDLRQSNDAIARGPMLAREGFVAYFAVPLIAKGYVKGVLEVFHRAPLVPDDAWLDFLRSLGEQAAIAVDNAELFNAMQRSNDELGVAYDATIEGWSRALDLRDKETEGHTLRVTTMAVQLAHRLGIADEELAHVRRGALLHDIGKMGIPDAVLLKPDSLTPSEWEIMRLHPVYAYELLAPIAYLKPALAIPHYHHEKWDGSGYPNQLSGAQIPLHARIFAIVDVWDALTHDRPYRAAWPPHRALEYLREQSGKHFDPTIVEMFFRMMEH